MKSTNNKIKRSLNEKLMKEIEHNAEWCKELEYNKEQDDFIIKNLNEALFTPSALPNEFELIIAESWFVKSTINKMKLFNIAIKESIRLGYKITEWKDPKTAAIHYHFKIAGNKKDEQL